MYFFTVRWPAIAAGVFAVLAVAVCSGCSGKKDENVKNTPPPVEYVNAQVATVQKARSFKVAFDNPKMGYCPVCGESVDYQSFATFGRKHYALCSEECAEKFEKDPESYLRAGNP
ncbi:MAG: hypothetical protein P8181_11075 [bacterium]